MWLQDFIWKLAYKENPVGTATKTQSQAGRKGFLGFSLNICNQDYSAAAMMSRTEGMP